MVINVVFESVVIGRIYILFSQMKWVNFPFWPQNWHGLMANYSKRKVCCLTSNYGYNRFAELQIGNSFSDHKSEFHYKLLPSYKEDLFSYHNSLPLVAFELQIKTFFSVKAGFSYVF